jgi:hypothetical protein
MSAGSYRRGSSERGYFRGLLVPVESWLLKWGGAVGATNAGCDEGEGGQCGMPHAWQLALWQARLAGPARRSILQPFADS